MAQVAYKYTWTLPWLHGLDNYSLGMNLNWHGHKIRLGQNQLLNQFCTLFRLQKSFFIFLHFIHELVLYPWIVFRVKKHLICELFSSSLSPSSTQKCCFMGSVASGRQRPSYALLVTDTQWGGATLLTAQMRMFHASRKLYSVDIFIWFSMLFYFCYARKDNLRRGDKFIWTLKCMGVHMFYLSMENFITLYHQLGACVL
jgi:hypothetical protein